MAATITTGHHAIVYVSGADAGTAFGPGEATTKVDGTVTTYTITAAPYRTETITKLVHPTETLTQTWAAGPTGTITVNRLKSQLISTVVEAGGNTVTLQGKYLEMAQLLYCKECRFTIEPTLDDDTPFNSKYYCSSHGMVKVSGTLGNFFDATQIPNAAPPAGFTGAIAPYFTTKMLANSTIAIKLFVKTGLTFLAWANVSGEDLKAAVEGNQEETVAWVGKPDLEGHAISRL